MNLTMPWTAKKKSPANGLAGKLDDVKRALSDEADHLATVAAQISRDAGKQASKVADDTASQAAAIAGGTAGAATGLAQQLLKGATTFGNQLATSGRKTAADLTSDAQSLGKELRGVRITTEPRKTGPDFMPGITLLGGFGAGIALMYFLDPEQGVRRRALLRDQLVKWTRVTRETVSGKAKDLSNRSVGVVHEARKAVTGTTDGTSETTDEQQGGYASSGNGWGDAPQGSPFSDQPVEQHERVEIT